MRGGSRSRAIGCALIAGVTLVAYAGSFSGGWVSDDVEMIVQDPIIRSLSPANLLAMFSSFYGPNYMPVDVLSIAIDYRFWGLDPPGYHATNLLMHMANALAIYWLLLRMGESSCAALVVALLWSVHPVQVESVAWVSERKNVLSTLFFLLAFHVYLGFSERPRGTQYVVLLALFVSALLTKINTIVLPAIMLAYEGTERFRIRRRDLLATLPFLAIGAVLAWVNLAGNPSHGVAYHGGSLAVTLRTSATVVVRYLGLTVLPISLRSYYATPLRSSWLEPAVAIAVIVILGMIALSAALVAWRRRGAFWLLWFLVTLSPMLNVVPFPALMADRYLYIPILGVLVLGARGATAIAHRLPHGPRVLPLASAVAVLACVWLTVERVPVFKDDLSLWADWALHSSYISADSPWGPPPRTREIEILTKALARDGDAAPLRNNLGAIAFEEGRLADAIAHLERARALDARDPVAALNLGRVYLHAGRFAEAARTLEDAARLEPPSYFAHLNLGRAYLRYGAPARAREALAHARALRPDWADWQREWAKLEAMEGK